VSVAEDKDLSPAAASLARAAPREWIEFKAAMDKYAARQRENLMNTSLDELQRSQGRAQACNTVALLMADAEKAAERISERLVRPRN
jgi:hypothetical protein